MRGLTRILLVVALLFGLMSCEKDLGSIIGIDADAPIHLRLDGSDFKWKNEKFSSDAGYFTANNHPEIVIKDGKGFTLDLDRGLVSKNGNEATLYIYINSDEIIEVNRLYNLADMACVDIRESGATQTLPSGGTVTTIITHCYRATEGSLKITRIETYGDYYLISGEFKFTGKCTTDGDIVTVSSGKFSDCKVHISYGTDCHWYLVE